MAAIGVALVAAALALNADWLDRHFLPSFFLPRRWYIRIHEVARWTMAAAGVAIVWRSRSIARRLTPRAFSSAVSIVAAAMLALGASELVLRRVSLRSAEWLMPEEEPRRQPDARLGWTLVPSRVGSTTVGGRALDYAIDAAGYRVRRVDEPVDPARPTVVFAGESVMFGEGLAWDETIPAQVGARLGVQSANLAVHGYSSDQTFLRLQSELPRFRQPIAVVTLFMTALFGRNLDDDRPHLGPGLTWIPAQPHGKLVSLAGLVVPYRRDETVERGIAVTREVLRSTVDLIRQRGADPLIVVPQFGADEPIDVRLRRRILDEAGLPYALVTIDSTWRLPWDRHPNAQAAATIADAIAARLSADGSSRHRDTKDHGESFNGRDTETRRAASDGRTTPQRGESGAEDRRNATNVRSTSLFARRCVSAIFCSRRRPASPVGRATGRLAATLQPGRDGPSSASRARRVGLGGAP